MWVKCNEMRTAILVLLLLIIILTIMLEDSWAPDPEEPYKQQHRIWIFF